MATARRAIPPTLRNAGEPAFRDSVERALRRAEAYLVDDAGSLAEIDEAVEDLGDAAVELADAAPVNVTGAAAAVGTSDQAAREDHRHDIDTDAVLDTIDSTRGTILSRGNTGWRGIDPGTSGYVLTSNGTGADPTYQAASSGAPADAQYVTLATNGTLSAERVLTAGHGVDFVDAGAGSTLTIDVDESELSFATPVALGTSLSEGAANTLARSDHVHTVPLSVIDAAMVIYEVNFSTLATNDLASATESIDDLTWNTNNVATLGTHQVLNGTGIQLSAGNNLGTQVTFTTTTRNCYYLDIPLGSFSLWDGRFDHIIEIYCPSFTLEGNGDHFFVGLYGIAASPQASSTGRVKIARISNSGGTIVTSSTNNTTTTNGITRTTENVIGLKVTAKGEGSAFYGAWSSGWPARMDGDTNFTVESGVISPLNHSNVRLVMGLGAVNDASATTTVVIERLRIRRVL